LGLSYDAGTAQLNETIDQPADQEDEAWTVGGEGWPFPGDLFDGKAGSLEKESI